MVRRTSDLSRCRSCGTYRETLVGLATIRGDYLAADPFRYGYRFAGILPAGTSGAVASWAPGPTLYLDQESDEPPVGALHFRSATEAGFLLGRDIEAEAFLEEWEPQDPIRTRADGIERADFRLRSVRKAAGFRPGADGNPAYYGGPGVRFAFPRKKM